MKKRAQILALFLFSFTIPHVANSQDAKASVLEVILTTYDVNRTETLVYLRVFSNGSAEAHPMRNVDFRTMALKKTQLSQTDLAALSEFLRSAGVQGLEPRYERSWGNIDFGQTWNITIGEGSNEKSIVLFNFQPFLARSKKKPYPQELEKLGCLIWDLRTKAIGEPLERDYVNGCRKLGY